MDSDLSSLVKYTAMNIRSQVVRAGKAVLQNFTKCRRRLAIIIYDGKSREVHHCKVSKGFIYIEYDVSMSLRFV